MLFGSDDPILKSILRIELFSYLFFFWQIISPVSLVLHTHTHTTQNTKKLNLIKINIAEVMIDL